MNREPVVVRYFAWVRERIGVGEEQVCLPETVVTAGDLLAWLQGRGEGYAYALEASDSIRVAVDHMHIDHDETIVGAREIALFPPMTGVEPMAAAPRLTIRVGIEDFDVGAEIAAVQAGDRSIGAVTSFVGYCRDEGGRLAALELEHYPGMAEAEIGRVVAAAVDRWPLDAVTVIHRCGLIRPGEQIVLVAVAASHRAAAFSACDFLMDFLKTRAPFWKKEHLAGDDDDGGWVAAKADDDRRSDRWRTD